MSGFRSTHTSITDNSLKVRNLITRDGLWNEYVVRNSFIPIEAESILNIPLNRRGCTVKRIWLGNSKGIYTVNAGYFLKAKGFHPPQFHSAHSLQGWWKLLWKLCIPPKVRIFLWRATSNFIHTASNLLSKQVTSSGYCPLCHYFEASISHCLIFCNMVRPIWKKSIFWQYLCKMKFTSFIDCALLIANELSKEKLE